METITRITSVLLFVGFANACASEQPNSLKTPLGQMVLCLYHTKSFTSTGYIVKTVGC